MSRNSPTIFSKTELRSFDAVFTSARKKKLEYTKELIRCWVESWGIDNIYVAFSGGLDSTVLLHICRSLFPEMKGAFNNTGLELPEIVSFVKSFDNIDILYPKIPFHKVIEKYGWPVISKEQAQFISEWRTTNSEDLRNLRWNGRDNGRSKIAECWKDIAVNAPFKISHKCCDILKKDPAKKYEKETGRKVIRGDMIEESQLRKQHGYICNLYDSNRPISKPLLRWNKNDIWAYININNLDYCKVYDQGWDRTGCIFCMYGIHKDNPNRFQMIQYPHPKLYDYVINKLGAKEVLKFMKIPYRIK